MCKKYNRGEGGATSAANVFYALEEKNPTRTFSISLCVTPHGLLGMMLLANSIRNFNRETYLIACMRTPLARKPPHDPSESRSAESTCTPTQPGNNYLCEKRSGCNVAQM
jgi:hypothetical protein